MGGIEQHIKEQWLFFLPYPPKTVSSFSISAVKMVHSFSFLRRRFSFSSNEVLSQLCCKVSKDSADLFALLLPAIEQSFLQCASCLPSGIQTRYPHKICPQNLDSPVSFQTNLDKRNATLIKDTMLQPTNTSKPTKC